MYICADEVVFSLLILQFSLYSTVIESYSYVSSLPFTNPGVARHVREGDDCLSCVLSLVHF